VILEPTLIPRLDYGKFIRCRFIRELLHEQDRGETFLKVLVRLGKQQNDIAVLRQGDGNSMR
jgi:hypothetical protein